MAIGQPFEPPAGTGILAAGDDLSPGSVIDLACSSGKHEERELDEDRSAIPYTDTDSERLLDEALRCLAAIRSPFGPADPGAVLSALISLGAEVQGRLDDAVAEARAAGYGWDAIAERLAVVNARAARRRHGAYCHWREKGCPLPIV
jgi:hypothetical protein